MKITKQSRPLYFTLKFADQKEANAFASTLNTAPVHTGSSHLAGREVNWFSEVEKVGDSHQCIEFLNGFFKSSAVRSLRLIQKYNPSIR